MTKTFALGRAGLALSLLLSPSLGCFDAADPDVTADEAELAALGGGPRCFGKADSDRFGEVVAAGDFDGDGDQDLAVAAYLDTDYRFSGAGAVYVYRRSGTSYVPWQRLSHTTLGLAEDYATRFGAEMVAADFDRDGKAELAIYTTGPNPSNSFPGRVIIAGVDAADSFAVEQVVTQTGLGTEEGGDQFGAHMAVGDFDADGAPNLAAAAPYDDENGTQWDGRVYIFRGGSAPQQLAAWKVLSPQSWNMPDVSFGFAIAAGDFDANGYDDLAVALPSYNPATPTTGEGTVLTYRSTATSTLAPSRLLEGRLYVSAPGNASAMFGQTLAALDMDGDGRDELAVGAPNAASGSDLQDGAVAIFKNAVSGPSLWHTVQMPYPGANQGKRLAVGNFDGNTTQDLVVGQDVYGSLGTMSIWKGRAGNTPVLGKAYSDTPDAFAAADLDLDGKSDLLVSPNGYSAPLTYGMGRTTYMPALDQTLYQEAPSCEPYWGAPPVISLRGARQRELDLRVTSTGSIDETFWLRSTGAVSWHETTLVADRTDTGLAAATQYCYIAKTLQLGSDAYSDSVTTCFNTAQAITAPTITLNSKTTSSLSVHIGGSSGATSIRSQLQGNASSSQTTQGVAIDRTFTNLSSNTQYCIVADAFHAAVNDWSQPRTTCFTTSAPVQTGTTTVTLSLNVPPQGYVWYSGSWGPITGAVPKKIRVPASSSEDYWLYFLKANRSTTECGDPDATVAVQDGGELDAAAIATIQGSTPTPGSQLYWVACHASSTNNLPDSIAVNLDWEKP